MSVLLVVVAVAFAWSMGAHYTGACMGMPHALRAVSAWQALVIMAPLALLGAALASHGVEHTVARTLTTATLGTGAEIVVVAVAFALTTAYNRLKVPTSTIQILVFALAGTALGAGIGVRWTAIGLLAIVWVLAPLAAAGLGFAGTRLLDKMPAFRAGPGPGSPGNGATTTGGKATSGNWLAIALVIAGAGASFVMGSNDVANATGSLVATHTFSPVAAGAIGGAGLALGVLTWGRPLLNRVAFDVVTVDRPMATAAQAVQAIVVIVAVSFGFFTSMNQALVGAMAGAGAARGRQTVNRPTLTGILRGWALGPAAGIALGY
ncbi:MAG: inorganic phosphate transporter, partial [Streptosporangiaceae bacterium]